jgi:hypothetical protein
MASATEIFNEIFKEITDSARKQLLLDCGQSSWMTVLLRLPQPRFIAAVNSS